MFIYIYCIWGSTIYLYNSSFSSFMDIFSQLWVIIWKPFWIWQLQFKWLQFLWSTFWVILLWESTIFTGSLYILLEYFKFYIRILKKCVRLRLPDFRTFLSKNFSWIYWILTQGCDIDCDVISTVWFTDVCDVNIVNNWIYLQEVSSQEEDLLDLNLRKYFSVYMLWYCLWCDRYCDMYCDVCWWLWCDDLWCDMYCDVLLITGS